MHSLPVRSTTEIIRVDSLDGLPQEVEMDTLVDFFHHTMKPYHDEPEDVRRGLEYALSSSAGRGGFILLALQEGLLVGALTMLDTGMKGFIPENVLLFVAVLPEQRGQGIGQALIERGLNETEGAVKLHVEHDNPSLRLYQRVGFENKYLEMRCNK
jgi:[ribosomal protein S18]-alanine N-acetyltransferase